MNIFNDIRLKKFISYCCGFTLPYVLYWLVIGSDPVFFIIWMMGIFVIFLIIKDKESDRSVKQKPEKIYEGWETIITRIDYWKYACLYEKATNCPDEYRCRILCNGIIPTITIYDDEYQQTVDLRSYFDRVWNPTENELRMFELQFGINIKGGLDLLAKVWPYNKIKEEDNEL